MKNSAINTVKSVAVDTVKVIVYPAHLVLQTGADLLNIGQAQAIKVIDGTPVMQSMFDQQTWTQNKQASVVNKYLQVKERIEKQRESNRQQDIDRLKKSLDKLEGVEHLTTEPASVVDDKYDAAGFLIKGDNGQVITPVVEVPTVDQIVDMIEQSTPKVPAPPKSTRKNSVAKAIEAAETKTTPLMTAAV